MKQKMMQVGAAIVSAVAMLVMLVLVDVPVHAASYVAVPTTMECSVWSAPSTNEAYRVKKIPAGYVVTIDNSVAVVSQDMDGKLFYKTSKGKYILCKCFFPNGQLPSSVTATVTKPQVTPTVNIPKPEDNKFIEVTKSTFEAEVLNSDRPVFMEIGGSWCSWCNKFGPVIEAACKKHPEIKFVHVTYDSSHSIDWLLPYLSYSPHGYPTDVVFKNGTVSLQTSGYMDSSDFESFLKKNVLK